MKEIELDSVLPHEIDHTDSTAPSELRGTENGITDLITPLEQTHPLTLPRNHLLHTGKETIAWNAGISAYDAAKHYEHFHHEHTLPPIEAASRIVNRPDHQIEQPADDDSLEEAIRKAKANDPFRAYITQLPWDGVIRGQFSDMFSHISSTALEGSNPERSARESGDTPLDPDVRAAYALSLWRELFDVAGLEKLGESVMKEDIGNPSDFDHLLHTSIAYLPELGGAGEVITPEIAHRVATERVASDIGDTPAELLRDRSLTMMYEHLTGEQLWNDQATSQMAGFFADFFGRRKLYLNWNTAAEQRPDAMIEAFVRTVNPNGKGSYRLDSVGDLKMPQSAVRQLIKSEAVVPIDDLDKHLDFEHRLDPLRSNLAGKPMGVPKIAQEFEKLGYRLTGADSYVKYEIKSADEIIEDVFAELGIGQADPEIQFGVLGHESRNMKGWLGLGKHKELKTPGEQYFRQMLALELFVGKERLKADLLERGWIQPGNEAGILHQVADYFTAHPEEWTVRNYSEMYDGWNPMHIDAPVPTAYSQDTVDKNPLDTYKNHRSDEERYQLGVKRLIERGELPGTPPSLEYILAAELYPIHKLFVSLGMNPEEARDSFGGVLAQFSDIESPLERMRAAASYLRHEIQVDAFDLRFEAQEAIDIELADRLTRRLIENMVGVEVTDEITYETLVATCVDTRNETYRVAMENSSDTIGTIGLAGHMGIPYDVINVTYVRPDAPPQAKKTFKGRLEDVRENFRPERLKQKAAESGAVAVETGSEMAHLAFHSLESPLAMSAVARTIPEVTIPLLAANLAKFTLGSYAEYFSPGIHERGRKWMERNGHGEPRYSLNLMKLDNERYGEDQDTYQNLYQQAQSENTAEAWAEFLTFAEDFQKRAGADFVEGMLTAINFDVSKWKPEPGKPKLFGIVGHGAQISTNNTDKMAYECGACGGHSGERNAVLMANFMNDVDVRGYLRDRGIDLQNIYAVAGIYNTTTSVTTWHGTEELLANPVTHDAVQDLLKKSEGADDVARFRHEIFLNRGVQYSLIDKVKSYTTWRGLPQEEKDRRAIYNNAHFRSEYPGEVRPESGHSQTGGHIMGRREYTRNMLSDIYTMTFHQNSVTGEMVPPGPITVAGGVVAGVRNEYRDLQLNMEEAPWKGQQSLGIGDFVVYNSAGSPDLYSGLSRQLGIGRVAPATRPNYIQIADTAVAIRNGKDTTIDTTAQLGYAIRTVVDPQRKLVLRQVRGESLKNVPYLTRYYQHLTFQHDENMRHAITSAEVFVRVPVKEN